jgi:hypothetical protein
LRVYHVLNQDNNLLFLTQIGFAKQSCFGSFQLSFLIFHTIVLKGLRYYYLLMLGIKLYRHYREDSLYFLIR